MKIEKISDNQIRCTLSHQDLEDRELKLSELAYGTDKAKELFRDMMQQASYQFGFEADDIPLMIEAIPVSRETLILIITKVEDPDELDTRFSKFSPDTEASDDEEYYQDDAESFSDRLFDTCGHIADLLKGVEESEDTVDDESYDEEMDDDDSPIPAETEFVPLSETLGFGRSKTEDTTENNSDIIRIFSFHSLDEATRLACHIAGMYNGENTIYKNNTTSHYYLVLHRSEHSPEEFNKVCNLASEYGRMERSTYATASHYEEHYSALIRDKAVQILAKL